jgi:hypothetical protein
MGNPAPVFFIRHPSFFSVFNILIDKSPAGAYYLFQLVINFCGFLICQDRGDE